MKGQYYRPDLPPLLSLFASTVDHVRLFGAVKANRDGNAVHVRLYRSLSTIKRLLKDGNVVRLRLLCRLCSPYRRQEPRPRSIRDGASCGGRRYAAANPLSHQRIETVAVGPMPPVIRVQDDRFVEVRPPRV